MSKNKNLNHLIEQEKLLYLEVEQLRYRLYLHDTSFVFGFFSLFYYIAQDIKHFFSQKRKGQASPDKIKKESITILFRRKNMLLFLEKTPYAWTVNFLRWLKKTMSFRSAQGEEKSHTKHSFLIFGTTFAADLQSRSVKIARKLAEKNKVIYIEGIFDEGKRAGWRIVETSTQFTAIRLTARKSFHLSYQKPSISEISQLKKSLKLVYKDFADFKTYIHHPFWDLVLSPKKNTFLFDHTDDFAHLHNAAKHIILSEKQLLKAASLITAPHAKLLRNKKSILIKNGVDWDQFKNTSHMIQTCDVGLCWIKKPVMGFIGTLDERFDEVLLGKLANAFPTASIVLVGNTDYRPVIAVAEQYPNIFPVGKQPYKKLPLLLQSFDILITPYKSFAQGVSVHPELPLYLASGKPIVTTGSAKSENKRMKQYMYLPTSHIDWMDSVDEALKEKKSSKKKSLRISLAKKLHWNVKQLHKKT